MSMTERRVRMVGVPYHTVLDWFTFALKGFPQCVHLPKIDGIPEDAKVLSVHHDQMMREMRFFISHPSFDEVPNGQMVPYHTGWNQEFVTAELMPTGDRRNPVSPEFHANGFSLHLSDATKEQLRKSLAESPPGKLTLAPEGFHVRPAAG